MTRVGVLVLTLGLFVTLLAGCGGSQPAAPAASTSAAPSASASKPAAAPTKELRIGTISGNSGANAPFGIPFIRGSELAVEDINAAGGIKVGSDTYSLKVISEDDKTDSAAAAAAAQKLYFQDNVKAFSTGATISGLAAWSTVAGPQKLPLLQLASPDSAIGADKPSAFKTYDGPNESIASLLAYVKKAYAGKTKISIAVRNDPSGLATVPPTQKASDALGFTIVSNDTVPVPISDWTPLLTKILPQKPDFIVVVCSPAEIGLLLKQATGMGWNGIVIGAGGGPIKEAFEIGGKENVQDRVISPAGDPNSPLAAPEEKAIATRYKAKFGDEIVVHAALAYDNLNLLKLAYEKAGSLDTDKVVNALVGMESVPTRYGPGAWGGQSIYGIKRQLYYPQYVGISRDGGWTILEKVAVQSFLRP